MWAHFWALDSVPLIYVSVFVPVPYCFDYCSFEGELEIREHDTSSFILFFKIVLAILGLLCFHISFRIICSSSAKNAIGILIGIALNLWIALGSMVILTILIPPIHEHSICFHLLVSFSISFISVLIVLWVQVFHLLG